MLPRRMKFDMRPEYRMERVGGMGMGQKFTPHIRRIVDPRMRDANTALPRVEQPAEDVPPMLVEES